MIRRFYHRALLAIFSVFLHIPAAWGDGVWLYEGGTPDLGTAGAGQSDGILKSETTTWGTA